jgi:flagellar biosynthetic protein FlhB
VASAESEGRTLPPTARKKKEARKKGQVPHSQDLSGWLVLLVVSFLIPDLFGFAAARIEGVLGLSLGDFAHPSSATALRMLGAGLYVAGELIAIILGVGLVLAVAAQLIQHRPVFAPAKLKPTASHMNPITNAKQKFSSQGLFTMAKDFTKLAVVALVTFEVVHAMIGIVGASAPVSIGTLVSYTGTKILTLIRILSAVGVVLGIADWAWMSHKMKDQQKMSPRDVKDEARQDDGSPEAKRVRRKAALSLRRSRMQGNPALADVVVTNPTHYAIALRYRAGRDRAPLVLARGADDQALAIKETAREARVPIIEDPPLARAVYAACDVGDEVPVELYQAVARVLATLYRLYPERRPEQQPAQRPRPAPQP